MFIDKACKRRSAPTPEVGGLTFNACIFIAKGKACEVCNFWENQVCIYKVSVLLTMCSYIVKCSCCELGVLRLLGILRS